MRQRALFLAGLMMGLLVCALVYADIPRITNFQGRLTDATGKFVPDGNYSLTFRLYNDSTGGTAKWSEGQLVSVSKGLFNAILGSATPIPDSIFANPNVWLGIQAGADPEMTPRQKLTSVAFAYKSLQSDTATFIKGGVDDGDWTIAGDNIYRLKGNVGIGIQPWMKLMVSDSLGVGSGSHFPFDVRSFFTSGPAYAGVTLGYRANGTSAIGGVVQSHNALPLMLGTANRPEALTISDNGNVGIGTTSPGSILYIQTTGSYIGLGDLAGSGSKMRWYAGAATDPYFGTITDHDLRFVTSSSVTEKMRITSSGNVGIGTTSPERNLDIFASNPNLRLRTTSGSPTITLDKSAGGYPGYIEFREAGVSKWQAGVSTTNDYYILNWPSSEYVFYASSGGNVGIGTASPQTKLDIQGSSSGTFNRILRLTNLNTTNNNTSVIDFWSANTGAAQQSYASIVGEFPSHASGNEQGALHFYTRNASDFASRLSINPSGRVGIGTTNPRSRLTLETQNLFGEDARRMIKMIPGNFQGRVYVSSSVDYIDFLKTDSLENYLDYMTISAKNGFFSGYLDVNQNGIFNGKVSIGTTSTTNILTVQQSSATDPIADSWTIYSSREYKRDINELTPQEYRVALDKILSVPVVKFHYKGNDTKEKIGVIAEEAPEEILSEGNSKAISLNEYVTLLHAALKAQQEEIELLKIKLEKLETSR